jgi:hypothetical protein
MATKDVAVGLVGLCRTGDFESPINQYYSEDIVSVEPHGESPESRGIAAVRAKGEWWVQNFEVHGVEVEGPYVNGDHFAVRFKLDTTNKKTGERSIMDEIGLYTVKGDKIVHEQFLV